MEVKVITSEDQLKTAFNIRIEVFVHEQQVPLEEEVDEFENDATHFLLYNNGTPIGTGRLRVLNAIGKVERICVLADYRKGGSGKCIMEAIEAHAVKANIKKLKLHGQTQAEHFYRKLGYTTVSDVFLEAGIPHIVMEKSI